MFAHVQNMHQAYEENSKLSFTGDLSLRKCQNTIKIILWNMADDDKVPETHSESVMGVALPFQVGPIYCTPATTVQACWWLWKEPGAHIEFESGASNNAAISWGKA